MYTCTYDCDYLKKNHDITKSSFFKIGNLKQKHILINIFQKEKEIKNCNKKLFKYHQKNKNKYLNVYK